MQQPKITTAQAKDFARVWTHNGVAILLTDIQCEFAADFANIVLASFIENAKREAAARAAAAAAPKIVTP